MVMWIGKGRDRPRDLRREMIEQTNAFLSWALSADRNLPRIPRRKVDDGGFTAMLRLPAARALVTRWWKRALDLIGDR